MQITQGAGATKFTTLLCKRGNVATQKAMFHFQQFKPFARQSVHVSPEFSRALARGNTGNGTRPGVYETSCIGGAIRTLNLMIQGPINKIDFELQRREQLLAGLDGLALEMSGEYAFAGIQRTTA